MSRVYLSSDIHFGHDKDFLYKPRGFTSIKEHDETIIKNWNNIVQPEDVVYILGDLMLGDNEHGIDCLKELNGSFHICLGNHDTITRQDLYAQLKSLKTIQYATILKYKKFHYYLSHYPTMTSSLEKEHLYECLINLFGHIHSKQKFYNEIPFMYNVSMDANNNCPILLDDIIENCKQQVNKCKELL